MQKSILASAALLAALASAHAADLPARTYTKAPLAAHAQAYDWTGFYLGANAGVGIGNNSSILNVTAGTFIPASNLAPIGAIGGAQAGYNWQRGDIVVGLEADIQASGMKDSSTCTLGCVAPVSFAPTQKLDWFGTARVRAGLATGPVYSYVTGGFAYGGVNTTAAGTTGLGPFGASVSETRTGWTIGSGVEASLGGNWTGKLEYLYLDLGNQIVPNVLLGAAANTSVDVQQHIFRAGVNYRIAGGRPYTTEPLANWRGLYAGLNAGSSIARSESAMTGFGAAERFVLQPKGYLGGAQIGYNWQASNWVYGVEADFQGANISDADNCLLTCAPAVVNVANVQQNLPWLGTARGRVGYSVGSTLFYGTGGLAYGDISNKVTIVATGAPINFSGEFSHQKAGWTAGGGIESELDVFGLLGRNWTVKSEYLYVDLGSVSDSFNANGFPMVATSKVQEHIMRTGINYHFSSPVVAKY